MSEQSIHDLRTRAQALGILDIFKLDLKNLKQQIDLKEKALSPPRSEPIPRPHYDARLMTASPHAMAEVASVKGILAPHIDRGLKLTFPDEETWHMAFGKREDTGSMRVPLRAVLMCAEQIMR